MVFKQIQTMNFTSFHFSSALLYYYFTSLSLIHSSILKYHLSYYSNQMKDLSLQNL